MRVKATAGCVTVVKLTVFLIQHQLLHLFPQILLVNVAGVKRVAHELRHAGAGGDVLLLLLAQRTEALNH